MRILFVHQNFPGQFVHLAPALAARGHEVHALMLHDRPVQGLPAARLHRYRLARGNTPGVDPWAVELETKVIRGQACARAAEQLARAGLTPDVVFAHPGWGEAMFLRHVWPQARHVHFVEYFYAAQGQDWGFDPEFPPADALAECRLTVKNMPLLQSLQGMDMGISPTLWQASTVPAEFGHKLRVVHDGIDTRLARPAAQAVFTAQTLDQRRITFKSGDPVISFVNRNLEPSRGYHRFMRALPAVLMRHREAQVVVVGGEGVSYGAASTENLRLKYLNEVAPQLDAQALARIHFVGRIPHASLIQLFQLCCAHVYLTYPFVLSWSMLEAMACGALVIGSDTPPVAEAITQGVNGLLVDFFDTAALADAMVQALGRPAGQDALRQAGVATVLARYDLQAVCLPQQVALLEGLG